MKSVKLKHLTDLANSIKSKTPAELKDFMDGVDEDGSDKILEDYPAHITPENSHYFDDPEKEHEDDDALTKLKRFRQYRDVQC